MNCIDCRYNLIKDGHSNCTYDGGECIKISVLEAENAELKEDLRNKKLAIKNRNGRIKELEEKISVLLSCENCQENKGGLICQKEYEDKCLTQKIQFIKELQEEIEELKEHHKSVCDTLTNTHRHIRGKLSEAKAIIRDLLRVTYGEGWNYSLGVKAMAEQFLNEE